MREGDFLPGSYRGVDRLIACVRIGRLPVQAEERRRPALKGRPFVITSSPSTSAGFVVACSVQGEALGLREGMPVREVPALCPEALLIPPDPDFYQSVHVRLADALEKWVPAVEEADLGGAYMDLTGMQRLYPRIDLLFQRIIEAVYAATGLRAGVGAGPSKFVAKVAADVADGRNVRILADECAAFLAPHSVDYLPLRHETKERLALLGLHTLAQVARLPKEALIAQFGEEGRLAWTLARGIDPSRVIPRRPFRPIVERLHFPAPVVEWAPLWSGIQQLLIRLWRRKERGGATVRQMEVVATCGDERWQRRLTFHEPVGELYRLEGMVKRRLADTPLPGAVEALAVKVSLLGGAYVAQEALFAERTERMGRIKEALEPLKARYGTSGLYRIAEVEPWSRIPERRYALIDFDL